jgi:hypothetical protein
VSECDLTKDRTWIDQWSCGLHGVWFRDGGEPELCPVGEAWLKSGQALALSEPKRLEAEREWREWMGWLEEGWRDAERTLDRVRQDRNDLEQDWAALRELVEPLKARAEAAEKALLQMQNAAMDVGARLDAAEASLREAVVHIRALILLRRDHLEDGMKDCDECSEGAQDAEAFLARVGGGSPG